MREIRFRAWDKKTEQYELLDSLFEFQKMNLAGYEYNERIFEQYTCFKDKNGVEIYEGDVIDGNLYDRKLPTRGQIVFDAHFSFYANKNEGGNTPIYRIAEIKIIGNIHENPELLND